jgi:hypothetical protein
MIDAEGKLNLANSRNAIIDRVQSMIEAELDATGKLSVPESVHNLLFGNVPYDPEMLQPVANVFRDATFAIPYTHGWNLSTQTLAAGLGLKTLSKGWQYAKLLRDKDPATIAKMKRLEALGVAGDYSGHGETAYGKIPVIGKKLKGALDWSNQELNRIDNGIKIAAAEKFASQGIKGTLLGAKIMDTYGDLEQSMAVKTLRSLGAFFPNWRLNVLPKTFLNAMKSKAGRRSIMAMNNSQAFLTRESEDRDNYAQGSGIHPKDYNLFPALNSVQELFEFPYGTEKYLDSSSVLGFLPLIKRLSEEKPTAALAEMAQEASPYSQAAQIALDLRQAQIKPTDPEFPMRVLEAIGALFGPRITPENETKGERKAYGIKRRMMPSTYPGLNNDLYPAHAP